MGCPQKGQPIFVSCITIAILRARETTKEPLLDGLILHLEFQIHTLILFGELSYVV